MSMKFWNFINISNRNGIKRDFGYRFIFILIMKTEVF